MRKKWIKGLIVVFLLSMFLNQIWEQIIKYLQNKTMLSVYNEKVESIRSPAISVCSNPAYRKSAKNKWNIFKISSDISVGSVKLPFEDNATLSEAWLKSTYVLGDSVVATLTDGRFEKAIPAYNATITSLFFGSCFTFVPIFNFTVGADLSLSVQYLTQEKPKAITFQIHEPADG